MRIRTSTYFTCLSPCVKVSAQTISFCSAVQAGLFEAAGPDMSGMTIPTSPASHLSSILALFLKNPAQWVSLIADLTLLFVLAGPRGFAALTRPAMYSQSAPS